MTVPPEFPTLRAVSSQPPTVHQLQSRFPTLAGLCGSFQPLVSAPEAVRVSSPRAVVGHVPLPLPGTQEDINFSVCSVFHLLGQSGNFQTPYVPNWKIPYAKLCASFSNMRGLVSLVRSPTDWAGLQGSFRLWEQLGMHWI